MIVAILETETIDNKKLITKFAIIQRNKTNHFKLRNNRYIPYKNYLIVGKRIIEDTEIVPYYNVAYEYTGRRLSNLSVYFNENSVSKQTLREFIEYVATSEHSKMDECYLENKLTKLNRIFEDFDNKIEEIYFTTKYDGIGYIDVREMKAIINGTESKINDIKKFLENFAIEFILGSQNQDNTLFIFSDLSEFERLKNFKLEGGYKCKK